MARGHFLCGVGGGIFDALFAFVVADLTRGTGVRLQPRCRRHCCMRGITEARKAVVRRVIALPRSKPRTSRRRQATTGVNARGCSNIAQPGHSSLKAHEMDGLTAILGSRPPSQEDFLKFYSSRRL